MARPFDEIYLNRRGPHRTQVGTAAPDHTRRGQPVGWIASCDCGWEEDGDRGGMAAGLAAARQHERDADAALEDAGPDA
jgi:hypothetical protein